jgi:hypothetical protein
VEEQFWQRLRPFHLRLSKPDYFLSTLWKTEAEKDHSKMTTPAEERALSQTIPMVLQVQFLRRPLAAAPRQKSAERSSVDTTRADMGVNVGKKLCRKNSSLWGHCFHDCRSLAGAHAIQKTHTHPEIQNIENNGGISRLHGLVDFYKPVRILIQKLIRVPLTFFNL